MICQHGDHGSHGPDGVHGVGCFRGFDRSCHAIGRIKRSIFGCVTRQPLHHSSQCSCSTILHIPHILHIFLVLRHRSCHVIGADRCTCEGTPGLSHYTEYTLDTLQSCTHLKWSSVLSDMYVYLHRQVRGSGDGEGFRMYV